MEHEFELPTLPEHLSSPPVFSGVRVTRSLALCVCFVDRCLSFFLAIVLSVLRFMVTPLVSVSERVSVSVSVSVSVLYLYLYLYCICICIVSVSVSV